MSVVAHSVPHIMKRAPHQYHPWRELRHLAHLTVEFRTLAVGVWGYTRGNRITLDQTMLQDERRCTLAHELEHYRRGHNGCQPPAVEAEVHQAVARRLIPFDQLFEALRWARNVHELADELWVDEDTVTTRLQHLHPSERTKIEALREELAG